MKKTRTFRGPLFINLAVMIFSTFFAYTVFATTGDAKCLKVHVPPTPNSVEYEGVRCYYVGGGQHTYEGLTNTCSNYSGSSSCNVTTCDLSNTSTQINCRTEIQ